MCWRVDSDGGSEGSGCGSCGSGGDALNGGRWGMGGYVGGGGVSGRCACTIMVGTAFHFSFSCPSSRFN